MANNFFKDFWKGTDSRPSFVSAGVMLELAKQVENLMLANNMSEAQLAKKIKRSKTYVVKILRGDVNVDSIMLAKLAIALNAKITLNLIEKTK